MDAQLGKKTIDAHVHLNYTPGYRWIGGDT
jgi:hypothetical protein